MKGIEWVDNLNKTIKKSYFFLIKAVNFVACTTF
jgi:hypothetical protein